MLTERLLAGRLNEAYQFVQTAACNSAMKACEPDLPDEWREARKSLNAYFNVDNLIRRLRNKLAFHTDLQTTREAYETVPLAEPMVDFLCFHQGECLWGSADVLASFAMISLAGEADVAAAVQRIADDLIRVASWFGTYVMHAQTAFIERHFPNAEPTLPPTVINGPNLLDVRVPFYCAKPSAM